jgi:signal transduction histidine kinase
MARELEPIFRRPYTAACWREVWIVVVDFVIATVGATIVIGTVTTAASLVLIVIGLPMAVLIAHFDRWWCGIERSRTAKILGRAVIARYAEPSGETRFARWLSVLRDRQAWLDALWMVAGLPVSFVTLFLTWLAWTCTLGLLAAPIYAWSIPEWIHRNDIAISIIAPLLAPAAAIAAAWITHGAVLARAGIAANVLGIPRRDMLEERVQTLSETRAGAVDAAVSELQRVERDLHDGAQARLVALAMDLGLAEQRLAQADAESAREHVANARGQAQAAMAELRDLVRGIGPSILTDRGLDAALTALVAGREPPVRLRVELQRTDVTAREMALYFVVAEALTNARKHAEASQISVHAWEDAAGRLIAEIVDDGVGGADPDAGSGLAGLRKRVAALDGMLTITSPRGGPTTIRAELPCES